jgi:hypothetical protein
MQGYGIELDSRVALEFWGRRFFFDLKHFICDFVFADGPTLPSIATRGLTAIRAACFMPGLSQWPHHFPQLIVAQCSGWARRRYPRSGIFRALSR